MFGTPVESELSGFDFYGDDPVRITQLKVPADQPPQELIFIPALLLLGGIAYLQYLRQRKQREVPA